MYVARAPSPHASYETYGSGLSQVKKWLLGPTTETAPKETIRICWEPPPDLTLTQHAEKEKSPFPKDPSLKSMMAQLQERNRSSIVVRDLCTLDADRLVVGVENGRIVTVDTRTHDHVDVTRCHHGVLQGLTPHPSKPTVFATAGEDGLLLIIDSLSRRVEAMKVLPAKGRSVAFRPDGRHIAVGFGLGALAVYDADTLRQIKLVRHCKEDIDEVRWTALEGG
jgi:WD40 repeat protein